MALTDYPPLQPGNFYRSIEAKVPQKFLRDHLNRLRFGAEAPLSDEVLHVPLDDIHATYKVDRKAGAPLFRRTQSGLVRGGDWDLSVLPTVDTDKYHACRAHFIDGLDWEETGIFDRHLKLIARYGVSDGCRTVDDLKRRYDRVDALFNETQLSGRLRPRCELPGYFRREHGGIFVHIDRNGRAIRRGGGEHRFAIARILNLPEVPVQPGVIHLDAVRGGDIPRLRRSIHD